MIPSAATLARDLASASGAGSGGLGSQGARYLLASLLALGCDLLAYTVLLRLGLPAPVAGGLGYGGGILVHYSLSTSWVFPDRNGQRRAMPTMAKFAGTGVFGLVMTAGIIAALTGSGLCGAYMAKVIAVGATYVAVFLLRRAYVFGPRSPS